MSVAICAFFALEQARQSSVRFSRVNLELPIDLNNAETSSGAVLTNVSLSGAFIETPRALPVGERVTLRLALADYGGPLAVTAEVRWRRSSHEVEGSFRPAGIGVRFIALRSGVSIRLARLLH